MKSLLLFLLSLAVLPVTAAGRMAAVEAGFACPPAASRPRTWWHWMDGHVSRTGITKDLEAMAAVGIGGATILDVGCFGPGFHGPVKTLSPEWFDLVQFALAEAKRLGLSLSMAACPGWSSTGGPWVRPAFAMKMIGFAETSVSGGRRVDVALRRCDWPCGYGGDVAVLAFPTTGARDGISYPDDADRIPDHALKTFAKCDLSGRYPVFEDTTRRCPPEAAIDPARLVDLTDRLTADGRLVWEAPAGDWTVCRFSFYTRPSANVPPTPEGRGLECDKLSFAGAEEGWRGMLAPVVAAARAAGTLSALSGVLVDSYEVGPQNWTEAMPEEFRRRRGYDIRPFLPVLAGRHVKDAPTTERFLQDFRRTVSELFADRYAAGLRRLANREGLQLELEPYHGPFDNLRYGRAADVPMGEFWVGPVWNCGNARLAANVADVNGLPYVQTETFSAGGGNAAWKAYPARLKSHGDFAFCEGVNRFVFHGYAHQSFETTGPGMTMGCWGFMFNRHNTLWPYFGPYLSYLGRAQFLLQQGRGVADVLHVMKSDTPSTPAWEPKTPFGFRANAVDADMFLADMKAEGGEMTLPCGQRYRVLVLPQTAIVPPKVLAKASALAEAGVEVVLGPRPVWAFGLSDGADAERRLAEETAKLWDGFADGAKSRRVGRGRVWRTSDLGEVLAAAGVAPDFTSEEPDVAPSKVFDNLWEMRVHFIHRTLADAEVYFVANLRDEELSLTGCFRATGAVELWDAETGERRPAPVWRTEKGRTKVPLTLSSGTSVFVVFRRDVAAAPHAERGRERRVCADERELSGSWQVSFEPHRGAPEGTVVLPFLESLSENADPGIRYFSGTATYEKSFDLPAEKPSGRWTLDLGQVCECARVFVNGREAGVCWHRPNALDVTDLLKPGVNRLVVQVGNRWINRLIGDEQAPLPKGLAYQRKLNAVSILTTMPKELVNGEQPTGRFAFSTCRPYEKDARLVPSGLLGPVRLFRSATAAGLTHQKAIHSASAGGIAF